MSSKTTTKSKSSSEPWAPAQPGLRNILSGAQDWGQSWQDRGIFGDAVQGFDPAQTAALSQMESRAQQGGGLTDAAQGYVGDVLSGKYLEQGNPYFDRVSQAVTRSVMPGINATFGGAGRTGSGAHQFHLTKALGDAMAPIAYQDYQNQMGRMDAAAQLAPGLDQADYYDMDKLFAVGQTRQGQGQAELSDEMRQFYEDQNRQLQALQQQAGLTIPIAGLGGKQSGTTTQSQSGNPLTMAVGGLMTAGGLFGGGGMGLPFMGGAPRMPSPYVPYSWGNTGASFAPYAGSVY